MPLYLCRAASAVVSEPCTRACHYVGAPLHVMLPSFSMRRTSVTGRANMTVRSSDGENLSLRYGPFDEMQLARTGLGLPDWIRYWKYCSHIWMKMSLSNRIQRCSAGLRSGDCGGGENDQGDPAPFCVHIVSSFAGGLCLLLVHFSSIGLASSSSIGTTQTTLLQHSI